MKCITGSLHCRLVSFICIALRDQILCEKQTTHSDIDLRFAHPPRCRFSKFPEIFFRSVFKKRKGNSISDINYPVEYVRASLGPLQYIHLSHLPILAIPGHSFYRHQGRCLTQKSSNAQPTCRRIHLNLTNHPRQSLVIEELSHVDASIST